MPPPRPHSLSSVTTLSRLLAFATLASVAVLTLLDRGATRAYATPWHALLWFAQLAPLILLLLRSLPGARPLALPSRAWTLTAAGFAAVVLLSALASPDRGPSLLFSLTPLAALAAFFLLHDWLAQDRERHGAQLLRIAGFFFFAVAVSSLARWLATDLIPSGAWRHLSSLVDHRNAEPLGHSNYTAGLALLMLPVFGALALRAFRPVEPDVPVGLFSTLSWSFATLLALVLLFTSGSRGGLLGLAALLCVALLHARLTWKKLLLAFLALAAASLALAFAHPRTRAMLLSRPLPAAVPNLSNVQRTAMLHAGTLMGLDRPLLGWGAGTTPLVFPRYRARLDGGAENVLQLHSLPLQLWADHGALGLACALAFLVLAFRAAVSSPPSLLRSLAVSSPPSPLRSVATIALAGYLVFSLTDAQLDVPLFALALAACAALLALRSPSQSNPLGYFPPRSSPALFTVLALTLVALLGRPDPTPVLNSRALLLARDPTPANTAAAIALLRDSLAQNPAQEIAAFNLGWLLVTRDPAAAAPHFLAAAHLVPDKGGVYFGLALARLNSNSRDAAVHALALECLDDPLFLTSPWWRVPSLAALRPAVVGETLRALTQLRPNLAAKKSFYALRELDYLAALIPWLDADPHASLGPVLAAARTPARVSYFAARPSPPDFAAAPVRAFHRERTGYPVLMRDLDLPPPVDVFEIQENALAAGDLAFLFPPKGWLPSPLLLSLLDAPAPVLPAP